MKEFMNEPQEQVIKAGECYDFKKHGPIMSKTHWKAYRRGFNDYATANTIAAYWWVEGARYGFENAMEQARETVSEQAEGRAEVDADDLLQALLNIKGVGDIVGARITEVFERYAEGEV